MNLDNKTKSANGRVKRILAPILLAVGLLLAAAFGFVGSVEATLKYDLSAYSESSDIRLVLTDEEGRRVIKSYFNLVGGRMKVEQKVDTPPGVYKASAFLTDSTRPDAVAQIVLERDGTYEVRLAPPAE